MSSPYTLALYESVICYMSLSRNAAALVMKINYDHDIAEEGDIYVDLAEKAMESVAQAAIHGTVVVDYVPIREPHHVLLVSQA